MPSKSDPHIYRWESASETEVRGISELFTRQEFKKGKRVPNIGADTIIKSDNVEEKTKTGLFLSKCNVRNLI